MTISTRHTIAAFLFICACTLLGPIKAVAQELQINVPSADTTAFDNLPSLSYDFYNMSSIMDRNYNYELLNRKRSIEMWAGEVKTIGMLTFIGVIVANSILAVDNNWNIWIDIPCATIVAIASIIPFRYWSRSLQRRADAIEISPTIGYINNDVIPNTALNPNPSNSSGLCFGINIKANF